MKSIDGARKPRGRPAVGSTAINLRLPPDLLAALDAWREGQQDAPRRPEAVRRLVAQAVDADDAIESCARLCEALCDGGEDDEKLIAAAASIRARAWDD